MCVNAFIGKCPFAKIMVFLFSEKVKRIDTMHRIENGNRDTDPNLDECDGHSSIKKRIVKFSGEKFYSLSSYIWLLRR